MSVQVKMSWWTPVIGSEERALVLEVLEGNFPNDGEYTDRFASEFAAFVGAPYAVAFSSGTAALFAALVAVGIRRGDEVIVPDLTFIATANAVMLAGGVPVLVDVRPDTFGMDPDRVRGAITDRTRAIIPVHVNGRDAGIVELCALAREHGLHVVEDAAETLGSRSSGQHLGTFGDAGCFSFAPTKPITTGQGGMVVMADADLMSRLRQVKDQGRAQRGTGGDDLHPVVGYNFKLTNLQGAMGIGQLHDLPRRVDHIRALHGLYREALADLGEHIRIPPIRAGETPCWVDALASDRGRLVADLRREGIETRNFWFPLHTQPPYSQPERDFPTALEISRTGFWLPSALSLDQHDVARVAEAIRRSTMSH